MVTTGGWTLMQDYDSGAGNAALGTVSTTTGGTVTKGGSIAAFNGGNPLVYDTTTDVPSGGSIQFIWLAFTGPSYTTATALGVSGDSTASVSTTEADPQNTNPETAAPFGVAPVPEPATLALAGLGGLSVLFFRLRKA
jgi:hypothetical protein